MPRSFHGTVVHFRLSGFNYDKHTDSGRVNRMTSWPLKSSAELGGRVGSQHLLQDRDGYSLNHAQATHNCWPTGLHSDEQQLAKGELCGILRRYCAWRARRRRSTTVVPSLYAIITAKLGPIRAQENHTHSHSDNRSARQCGADERKPVATKSDWRLLLLVRRQCFYTCASLSCNPAILLSCYPAILLSVTVCALRATQQWPRNTLPSITRWTITATTTFSTNVLDSN